LFYPYAVQRLPTFRHDVGLDCFWGKVCSSAGPGNSMAPYTQPRRPGSQIFFRRRIERLDYP
jgi:hypothetical protein